MSLRNALEGRHVAIFSLEEDLHALIIQKGLQERFGVTCSFVVTNHTCGKPILTWSLDPNIRPTLLTHTGSTIDVRDLDLIWWRRSGHSQIIPAHLKDPSHLDVINNDCRESLLGMLLTEFKGVWVSDPRATRVAENKLVQLKVASRAGFRIPRTLVSQDPEQIKRFCASLENRVVVKAVRGTVKTPLLTTAVKDELFDHPGSIMLSPAIYQELIVGTRHVRAHCFGDIVIAVVIECNSLDWRLHLDSPTTVYEVPERAKRRLHDVLKKLGLRMGIFDLKLTGDDELVWLEVNPQGQFLFIQGMCGLDLEKAFCQFLRAALMTRATFPSNCLTEDAQSGE